MSVQASAKSLLVEVMGNQTNASAQNEQTVQNTHLQVIFSLLCAECSAVAHQVDEADSHGTINVQDQVVLLGCGDGLNSKSIIEHLAAGETLLDELLDKLNSEIGVVSRLDLVANTGMSLFCLRMVSTKSRGLRPLSKAFVNSSAAPSRAPPNLDPMVKRPLTRALMRSFPALVVMMVFMAPDTAGP
jgi:hypothetical protein